MYDLLIKQGRVLDPGQGIDEVTDIGITGGRIAAVQPDLPADEAKRVLEIRGEHRYVVPGLIDIHTHVAHGATTLGVGMECCDPDAAGVRSGVTTVVDCGSVGVANIGVFPVHILPRAQTRVICYVNAGSYAHTMPNPADVNSLDEVSPAAIERCVERNPGLVSGVKLRLVGPIVEERGEELVTLTKSIARRHGLPLMVHIGDSHAPERAHPEQVAATTRAVLRALEPSDILTHLCTPHVGGVLDEARRPLPELNEARANGVVLDPALGMGNFGYQVAREQAELGLPPDTISSDLTALGKTFHSLVECMAKFMAVGYSLQDVVRMTTVNAARAIGREDELGAIAAGREADITILDVVPGRFTFVDTTRNAFSGEYGIAPVHTIRAGELYAPDWGTHPWGWLPAAG